MEEPARHVNGGKRPEYRIFRLMEVEEWRHDDEKKIMPAEPAKTVIFCKYCHRRINDVINFIEMQDGSFAHWPCIANADAFPLLWL